MDERAIHTVETKSEHITGNNGTFCCIPTAPYRLESLDVSGDGRKARNDSDKHAEIFKSDKQLASLPPREGGFTGYHCCLPAVSDLCLS